MQKCVAKGCIGAVLLVFGMSANSQTNSVQVYGQADAGVEYVNKVRTGGVGSATESVTRLQSGSASSSRLGFRGREDLGSGLTALFALENGFAIDNGALSQGGRLFGRHAYVGLSSKTLGELQIGRETTAIYDFGLVFDPVAASRYSAVVFDAAYAGRADNALKYIGTYGGVKAIAQYSFGYDSLVANGGELAGAYRVGKEMGLHLLYTAGPFAVGAAYDRQNGTSIATQFNKTERKVVGASYTLQPFTMYAAYQRQTVKTPISAVDTDLYWIGAQYRATNALLISPTLYFNDPDGGENRSTMFTVMANYAVSKRTDFYTELAFMKNQDTATLGMGGAVNPGDSQAAIIVGIRHRF
ncbi:porin [Noviherbaspirillum malthae]|uniref:porin n=1 Tax=Noviherbaspirillum malthae TaxID=1260987 RepID=UPI00188E2F37|nr:porin [Noviherbaspirillum malthae]